MTNGQTTLTFKHEYTQARQASIDALALAVTWLPEGEGAAIKQEMKGRAADLMDLLRRCRQSRYEKGDSSMASL